MKEKIKEIINSKYFDVILVGVINIVFFIICNDLFTPKYEQVDDFMIMTLISKADGLYSIYGIQMHPLICGIIVLLFKTGININWYTVFLLAMQFISFTIIGTVFLKKNKTLGIPIYIAFIFMIYSKMLCYIQYTTISMLCIVAGFMLLMHSMQQIKNINKFSLVISILMFALGCMIRFSTILIAVPFLGIYFVCKFFKDKDFKIIKVCFILILAIFFVYISFNIIYNINPIYKEFLRFHDARTYLHDYNILGYYPNKEIYDSVGWSGNDRDLFYGYLYGDEETYSIENLETIKDMHLNNKSNIDFVSKLSNTINKFLSFIKDDLYKYIFWMSILLLVTNNLFIFSKNLKDKSEDREDNIKICYINLILIAVLLMHCLFIFLDRPMFRVVISLYILWITLLLYEFLNNVKINKNKYIKYILVIVLLVISALEFKENVYLGKLYNQDDYKVYREIIDYTSSHKENAYLYTISMHDRFLAYSIYKKVPDDIFLNLNALGDWDTYTANYYSFKERYNIDNLIESLIKKDNVYLISGNFIWREDIEMIKEYIQEHYDINVKVNIIKEFDYDIKIYKLEGI